MKKYIYLIILINVVCSCSLEQRGFEFENFEDTPLWELAKAVKDNDVEEIREIASQSKVEINFKDPKCEYTLLTQAIANDKKEAFLELLKIGADPNFICGKIKSRISPLKIAIKYQKDNDLFFIENLLKMGANPNLKTTNQYEYSSTYTLPLAEAISYGNSSKDVLELLIKYGANINKCIYGESNEQYCEGVIDFCFMYSRMDLLRFFIIEKKIKIPKEPFIEWYIPELDKNEKLYTFEEVLNFESNEYEDFEDELGKHDNSNNRRIIKEILLYVKSK